MRVDRSTPDVRERERERERERRRRRRARIDKRMGGVWNFIVTIKSPYYNYMTNNLNTQHKITRTVLSPGLAGCTCIVITVEVDAVPSPLPRLEKWWEVAGGGRSGEGAEEGGGGVTGRSSHFLAVGEVTDLGDTSDAKAF